MATEEDELTAKRKEIEPFLATAIRVVSMLERRVIEKHFGAVKSLWLPLKTTQIVRSIQNICK